jgi:hypothetical protein
MAEIDRLSDKDRMVIETLRDKWDDCAHDLLQAKAFGEEGEVKDMTQEEVMDIISDMVSGSMGMYSGEQAEAVRYFTELPIDSEIRKLILKTAFPFSHYGY